MDTTRPHSHSVFALLAHWLIFARALIGCARRVSNMQRTRAPEAWACAHQLELCARAGLIEIMRDVRAIHAREDTLSDAEQAAFRRLTTIAGALIALAFFAQHLKAQLAGRGVSAVLMQAPNRPEAVLRLSGIGRAAPGYLDSS